MTWAFSTHVIFASKVRRLSFFERIKLMVGRKKERNKERFPADHESIPIVHVYEPFRRLDSFVNVT